MSKLNAIHSFGKAIILIFTLTFCNDESVVDAKQGSLTGKWQLVEWEFSAGGPSTWADVSEGEVYTFNNDGSFIISKHPHCTSGMFEITGDTLSLNYDCVEYNVTWKYHLSEFTPSSFIISPITVMCIEGCKFKYVRID